MMAETASFISEPRGAESGERLFLLASINIFIAVILVAFSLLLLPATLGKLKSEFITPISAVVFGSVVFGALWWVFHGVVYRMPASLGLLDAIPGIIAGGILAYYLYYFLLSEKYMYSRSISIDWKFALGDEAKSRKYLLNLTFMPVIVFTVFSHIYFAYTFEDGGKVSDWDMIIFCFIIIVSYVLIVFAVIKLMYNELPFLQTVAEKFNLATTRIKPVFNTRNLPKLKKTPTRNTTSNKSPDKETVKK